MGKKSSTLKIKLLGDFRVETGSRTIESAAWRLRKAGHIVKLLALAPHQRLHREQLLDLLWPDLPPESAANNMRVTLHTARQMLAPDAPGTAIGLDRDWLTLAPASPPDVDVARFEAAAARAQRGDDPATLRAAVDVYGGELLPDDPYEEWAIERRAALRETYLRLLLQLGRVLGERGQFAEAAATYRQALDTERTLEAAHRGLMRAYAATGRREQAILQFREAERILRAELEVEPDPETVALFRLIEAGAAIDMPQAEGAPDEPMRRPRSIARPLEASLPAEPRTSFIGRQAELADIPARFDAARLLTLTGPGGIGKTRLALRAVAMLEPQFDSAHIVELAGVQNPELVPEAVAAALGARSQPELPAIERAANLIGDRSVLLVVDNCEHLLDACARLTDELLDACPNLRLLATSRQRLGVPGESILQVPPLPVPESPDAALDAGDEAARLFLDRARLYAPDLRIDASTASALVRICRATDGVPLAIELAAARLPVLGLEQLAERLGGALDLLRSGPRTVDPRHQSLEAALDWSYELLSASERGLLAQLAVFASGWTLEAAEKICDANHEPILEGLFQLVDKSLVLVTEDASGAVRYRMLEPIRQYAERLLERTAEVELVRARHCAWYLQLAERADQELAGPLHQFWLERLETEHDNLRAALGWCLATREIESGQRIAAAIWRFWELRGHLGEGRAWLERMLSAGGSAPPTVAARAYNAAGNLAADQGDYARSNAHYEQSLARFREAGDRQGVARVLNNLAINASEQGEFGTAEARYAESLALSRELGDRWQIARALNNLGAMSLYSGRYDRAEQLLAEAHQLWLALGDRSAYAQSLDLAGELARERGNMERATALHEQSLDIRRELGDQRHVAASLHNLAVIALCEGDAERAAELARTALGIRREVGFQRGVVHSLAVLAQAALYGGEHDGASELYRESLLLRRELGSHEQLAGSLAGVAAVALEQGHAEPATRLLACAQALQEALGTPPPRVDRDLLSQTRERCRAALAPRAFEACWASGQALAAADAITQALSLTDR